jgi:predicted phosphohydrolase
MSIFAIADLHLAFSVPDKSMEVFGKPWENYEKLIEEAWKSSITNSDLVLIPGDISWAKTLDQALIDLNWIDALPGTKLILRGNHDYWWSSITKVRQALPRSIHAIQNDAFHWKDASIAGSRLWDTNEFSFKNCVEYVTNDRIKKMEEPEKPEEQEGIFLRELGRLELSLKQLKPSAKLKIAMTHYPPIGPDLKPSRASLLLEKYGIHQCVFGHLHSVKQNLMMLGEKNNIYYHLIAADYLRFKPLLVQ